MASQNNYDNDCNIIKQPVSHEELKTVMNEFKNQIELLKDENKKLVNLIKNNKKNNMIKNVIVKVKENTENEKKFRSFKVKLPGTDDYIGRFTGLSPYQAANKCLSKYFRENRKPKPAITFSIRESTLGSKKEIFTYTGHRVKLDVPIKYSIKSSDGQNREIVKEYKNILMKVKKNDIKKLEELNKPEDEIIIDKTKNFELFLELRKKIAIKLSIPNNFKIDVIASFVQREIKANNKNLSQIEISKKAYELFESNIEKYKKLL